MLGSNQAINTTAEKLTSGINGTIPVGLQSRLQIIMNGMNPELFQYIYWRQDEPESIRDFHYFTGQYDASSFLAENRLLVVEHSQFKRLVEFTADELKNSKFGGFYNNFPYQRYLFISFSDSFGFKAILTLCLNQEQCIESHLLKEIIHECSSFVALAADEVTVGLKADTGQFHSNSLTTEYLRSVAEISSRYVKSLTRQISQERQLMAHQGESYTFRPSHDKIIYASSREDLFTAINEALKKSCPVSGFAIFLADENKRKFSLYNSKGDAKEQGHAQAATSLLGLSDINEGLFGQAPDAGIPVVFNVFEIYKNHPYLPYSEFWKKAGIETIACTPLSNSNNSFGYLLLYFKEGNIKKPKLKIVEALAVRISVAISNIGVIENIKEAESEKSSLLALGNCLSNVRTKSALLQIMNNQVKELISFADFMICLFDTQKHAYRALLHSGIAFAADVDLKDSLIPNRWYRDGIADLVFLNGSPTVYPVGNLSTVIGIVPEYVHRAQERGAKELILIPLKEEQSNFGCILFFTENVETSASINRYLTRGMIELLRMTVSTVVTIEQLTLKEKEKEILLSLNNELGQVSNPEELAKGISVKLNKLFCVKNYNIFITEKTKRIWQYFTGDTDDQNWKADGTQHPGFLAKEGFFNEVFHSESYCICDIDRLHKWEDSVTADKSHGIAINPEKVVGLPLRYLGQSVGIIILEMEPFVDFELINHRFLKDVVSQVAVAVARIISENDITKRELEKSKLLAFSEGIATARDKNGLSLLLKPYLTTIFGIKEFIITLKNSDQVTFSYFLHDLQSDVPVNLGPNFVSYSEIPQKGSLLEQVMLSDEPVIFNTPQLIQSGALWEYVGAPRAMGSRLKVGTKDVGILWTQPDQISDYLLKGICSQVAIAVANVMANEEIIQKKKEREALLSLNTALATVRNGSDLQRIINVRLKQFLSCSHALIGKISEDNITAMAYLTDPDSKSKDDPGYGRALSLHYDINDGLMNRAAVSSSPIAFNLQEIVRSGSAPLYAEINFQNGLKSLVIARLLSGSHIFGFWMVFFEEDVINDDKLELVESLTNQISIAISHITTNEEIQKREEEKGKLLEFSAAISSVREREIFAGVLKVQLKKLFGIEDYIIYSLSENKQSYSPLLFHSDHIYASRPEFRKHVNRENDINDGTFNVTMASDGPVIHDIDEIARRGSLPSYLQVAREFNVKKMVGISLRIGQENIAVMNFQLEDANETHLFGHMFKSICSLLAIAVANIIANERVIKQLLEIDDYKQQLEEEQIYLKEELQTNQNYGEIIGESQEIQDTFRLVTQVAPSDSTVLILGETGTGKELIARAIHNNSSRKNKLMVKVNCAALPANLIESELFGHERGSFTGATDRRIGKFELANNGTLFLDEVGEMPVELQVKLLRAIQEKEIERIGGKGTIKVNVRIIAATNRDLEMEMEQGRFRSDLYYRLNIFPINLSPLRERKEDIPLLARHFINRYSKKTGKKIKSLSGRILQELTKYSWPGNIRELEHLLERSVLLTQGDTIKQIYLPKEKSNEVGQMSSGELVLKTIDENERDHILQILKYCRGRIAGPGGAAQLLGVPPSTLNSKLKKLDIRKSYLG